MNPPGEKTAVMHPEKGKKENINLGLSTPEIKRQTKKTLIMKGTHSYPTTSVITSA